MKNKEVRAFTFEVRADEVDGKNIITGRPIVYESETDLGEFREVIEEGALEGTDLKDVPFFVNHNIDMIPLARSRNNNENSTLQMKVDEKGMAIRTELDVERNADAKALYSATERGDIDGMSFMFGRVIDEWEDLDTDRPLRRIKKIEKVYEVSAVTFPVYEETSLETAGARSKAEVLESAKATLESVRAKEARKAELINKLKEIRKG